MDKTPIIEDVELEIEVEEVEQPKKKEAPEKKEKSKEQRFQEVKKLFESDKAWRSSSVDRQWWINRSYYQGNQGTRYNPETGRLIDDPQDPLKLQINKIKLAVRVVRSVLTRTNPVWDVDSYPYGTVPADQVKRLNQFMGQLYEKLDLKQTVKEAVFYALTCGLGIFQYGFDADEDYGEGELWVEALDPLDVYFGGKTATSADSIERFTKVCTRSISYMKEKEEDGVYSNTKNLAPDSKTSDSTYKEMLNLLNNNSGAGGSNDDGTVLVRETWLKEGNDIWVVTWTDKTWHRVEKTEFKQLPIVLYQPDITPGQLYGEGWVKDLVPLQRAINYLHRKIMKYNQKMAVGVYVTDQESGISMITNESGQIIKKQRGSEFRSESPAPLNSTPFNQLNDLYMQFSDISGVQDALIGRTPPGVTAAVALETLVSNAASNYVDLIDNLGISLANLGDSLLNLAYTSYGVTKTFKVKDASGNESTVKVGGENASISEREIISGSAIRLPERSEVRVKIVEGGTYTRQARVEMLTALRGTGDIDRHTYLVELGLDADTIEQKLMQEMQGMPNTVGEMGVQSVEESPQAGEMPVATEPMMDESLPMDINPEDLTDEELLALAGQV